MRLGGSRSVSGTNHQGERPQPGEIEVDLGASDGAGYLVFDLGIRFDFGARLRVRQ